VADCATGGCNKKGENTCVWKAFQSEGKEVGTRLPTSTVTKFERGDFGKKTCKTTKRKNQGDDSLFVGTKNLWTEINSGQRFVSGNCL